MSIDWDNIRVASPCHARWEDMVGDERARFCGQCRKNVFNLSAMTQTQIETLIREKEGKFCGRFYQRPDGRMITADCPAGQRRRRNRLLHWGGAMFATVLMILGVRTTGRAQDPSKRGPFNGNPTRLMGEVSVTLVRMGDIAVSRPAVTNCPATNHPPMIMGKIAIPPKTNQISQPIRSK